MKDRFLLEMEHPVVRNHTVYHQHVLPGLAYIDLLYQFFRAHGHNYSTLELRNLAIFRPAVVELEHPLQLKLEATQEDNGTWRVVVCGEEPSPDSQDRRYISAEIHPAAPKAFDEIIDLALIARRATKVTALDEIYERCRKDSLLHTGFMKAQGSLYTTTDAFYCELLVSPEAVTDAEHLMFHPALMDAAAVCAGAALSAGAKSGQTRLFLPLFYQSFQASALLQRQCIVRIPLASFRRTGEVKHFSLEFFDAAGRKVAELKNFACKDVRHPELIAAASKASRFVGTEELRPADVPDALVGNLAPAHSSTRTQMEQFLRQVIADKLQKPPHQIRSNAGYYELGLNSAALLEIVHTIERALGAALSPTLLFEHTNIAALASYLAETDGKTLGQYGNQPSVVAAPVSSNGNASTAKIAGPVAPTVNRASKTEKEPIAIAIIGVSGRHPEAVDLRQYWENLKAGKDCIREVPYERWDYRQYFDPEKNQPGKSCCKWGGFIDEVDRFDPLFFNISPREAELVDPQQRLLLETVWNLLESTGYTQARQQEVCGGSVGVYVGAMYQMYSSLEADLTRSSVMALSSYGAIANRISYWFGLSGPSIAIDTMCSSAMTAVHLACGALSKGECRMAIAGGVNLSIHPRKYIGLSQRQLIGSNPQRRSFAEGDGFLPAEAVGAVLLKPLACALEDGDEILAVIKATAGNHSGRAGGFAVPSVVAQQKLIEELLELSGAHPRTISYVEAAANGAALSDAAEVTALSQAFARLTSDRQFCAIGSVKSVIGHPEAASGMAQLIKVVLQLRHAHLTPTIKSDPPNPHIDFEDSPFYLQHELTEWRRPKIMLNGQEKEHPRRAIINSIGAGGSNAGMLIEEYIGSGELPDDAPEPADGQYAMVFSAKTPERLQVHVQQMLRYVKEHEELSLARMAYTLQNGREAMDSRLAFVVNNRDELIRALEMYLAGAVDRHVFGPSFALYIGEVLRERSEIDDFTEGEMGENIVRMLLARRNLPKLALLWSRGVDVPWASLYSHRRLRLAELPTYPFARERCWPSETQIAEEPVPEVEPASHHHTVAPASGMEAARSARSSRSELPRTDLERAVARVWEEVLGISGVRIRDNFLDLGGSSLTGGQIITRLRELFGIEIPMRAMIGAQPTVESLAVEVVAALLNARENSLSEQNAQAVAGD